MKHQKSIKNNPTLHVYYNSACPICKKGIDWQKKKMMLGVLWRDIDLDNQCVDDIGKELEVMRKYLHIGDDGKVYVGFEAFIKLWENSPMETWKAKIFSLPIIRPMGNLLYFAFANVLYAWNKLCKNW